MLKTINTYRVHDVLDEFNKYNELLAVMERVKEIYLAYNTLYRTGIISLRDKMDLQRELKIWVMTRYNLDKKEEGELFKWL